MKRRSERIRDALRTQLWPVPAIAVVLSVGLGIFLPRLDAAVDDSLPPAVTALLFGGGPEAARSVLEAISGSLITVTSLTFSLTVVTLQLASSQFSPRLLRTFTRDRFVHFTLALFLATFVFALTVLRSVRTQQDEDGPFVPEISVTVSFVLSLASVMGLVLFLAHLTREIRVETMMRNVHEETKVTIDRIFPAGAPPQPQEPQPGPGSIPITSASSGFLTSIDEQALLQAARETGTVVRIDREPGSSLIEGVPFARAWKPGSGRALNTEEAAELGKRVNEAVATGFERTNVQDVAFGFRQLVDVAARALSPGINDPTTAIHVLGHLSSLLCCLVDRNPGPRMMTDNDDGGRVRVVLALPGVEELLDLAVSQPRLYGAKDPTVAARLIELLREVAWCDKHRRYRAAVARQLEQLRSAIEAASLEEKERIRLIQAADETAALLAN
ncbi:DUF2254 domain-containing protein [Arthrobacter crystallopoietes]|uniref:Uncharacterized membrane protein n=1 Tax=Crystallibacter crystallopoietes TaxID=37928 RepID=A0A1H0ZEJ4_9MICC|nr:DUF2254 domain-containing protein [Arthrobacter crystallopoietes]AUI52018.1 hypothetical protein AC20117_15710 [Arthrobacter crystallopoietes]SDQ25945.1 Uncharacterized membrane protein [Arthrobacter crystallopoietes]